MEKLNRKGFTLVELLAVIIILAIVVGITIPAVLTTTNKAKEKAFQNAAMSASDWFERQYNVARNGLGETDLVTLDATFSTVCGSTGATCAPTTAAWVNVTGAVTAAGLNTNNIAKMEVYINPNTGRACLKLTAKANGDYANGATVLSPEKTTSCGATLS